jgi:hypothetical protein
LYEGHQGPLGQRLAQGLLEPVARVAALVHAVFACAHQIPHDFVGRPGDTHCSEISRSIQSRQQHGVAPIGLDAVSRALRDRGRGHDVTCPAQRRQVAPVTNPQGPAS